MFSGELPQLEKPNAALREIGGRHAVVPAQVEAAVLELSAGEIQAIEALGSQAGVNVIRYWEKEMK